MLSAHIVFGDINNHSEMPFPERTRTLKKFWSICKKHEPRELNSHSFYETDNDSFMAGFSSVKGLLWGEDVIDFTISLQNDLKKHDIDVSFGINLVACQNDIKWKTYPGFIDDVKMIYMPDELFEEKGKIQRNKLSGDSLIVTARIQSLAKLINKTICISQFQGGNIQNNHKYVLKDISEKIVKLNNKHCKWLQKRHVKVFILENDY